MKKILLLTLGFLCLESLAQSILPQMKTSLYEKEKPLTLQSLAVSVYIMGDKAQTTLDATFHNPNPRTLEGEFEFPLLRNMEISGFALDINGQLREGVVVSKEKGRQTFENIVRQKIDPALLEKTTGNHFKARVYPMPANGTRRVVIEIIQNLEKQGNNLSYHLPIATKGLLLKEYKQAIKIAHTPTQKAQPTMGNTQWESNLESNFSAKDYEIKEDISLSIPIESETIYTAKMNQEWLFAGGISLNYAKEQREIPQKIALYWDASASEKKEEQTPKIAFLKEYFNYTKNISVDFYSFNITKSTKKEFYIKNGDATALFTHINQIEPEGATNLQVVDLSEKYDQIILVSNAIHNFGGQNFSEEKWARNTLSPIIALASIGANTALLHTLTAHSGGTLVDLTQQTPQEQILQVSQKPLQLIEIHTLSGEAIEFYPKEKTSISKPYFTFAGIAKEKNTTLELCFGYGNKTIFTQKINLQAREIDSQKAPLIRHFLGKEHIGWARSLGKKQQEIDALGQKYGVVTEGTSLIVLETLDDYLRYEITPPIELQNSFYHQQINAKKAEKEHKIQAQKEHIQRVIKASEKQTRWWNTLFPKKNNTPKKETQALFYEQSARSAEQEVQYEAEEIAMHTDTAKEMAPAPVLRQAEKVISTNAVAKRRAFAAPSPARANASTSEPIEIELAPWKPASVYYKVLEYANEANLYDTYLRLKKEYGTSPAFYTDAADFFFQKGDTDKAKLIASNLAELEAENPQLLRMLSYKLLHYKLYDEAIFTLTKLTTIRGEEPQSFRDLGLAYKRNGQWEKAIEALYKVVTLGNTRFWGIELIAMNEINQIMAHQKKISPKYINKELIKHEPVDIRIVLEWDTDSCDIDLWVTDPTGERCFYSNPLTHIGGKISYDFTGGYGPEEFLLKKAIKGTYKVEANYFGNHSQKLLFPITVKVKFYTHYGTPQQKLQETTVVLSASKETIEIGSFQFK